MIIIDVVTSFIIYKGRVLLVKRSSSMPSFPLKWGAVSGTVHERAKLIDAAYREIFEETGISRGALALASHISPFIVSEGNTTWRIHSFLFFSRTSKVSLNNENTTHVLAYPEEIESYDIVTGLFDSYCNLILSLKPEENTR